jgi:hypothetical protein
VRRREPQRIRNQPQLEAALHTRVAADSPD